MSEIYHIIPSFYPVIGGAEKQLERLARVQAISGNKVYILTRQLPVGEDTPKDFENIEIVRLKAPNMAIFNIYLFSYIFKNKSNVKLVHVHSLSSVAFTALLTAWILGFKVLVKITRIGVGSQPELVSNSILKKQILLIFNRLVNIEMICLTDESTNYINQLFPAIKTCLIPNGIEIRNEIPRKVIGDVITFVFVSRLIERKNVMNSIMLMLENISYDYKIIVCGSGEELEDIVLLANKNPHIIEVLGQLDENALHRIYSKSNFFVQNSFNEGLSNSFLESLSMNVVPIVSRNEFYVGLNEKYSVPLFFDQFLKVEHAKIIEMYPKLIEKVAEMVKSEFDINKTKNKLNVKYFES
jgi:glycosyltransferase involved in cell wall biosynthesis